MIFCYGNEAQIGELTDGSRSVTRTKPTVFVSSYTLPCFSFAPIALIACNCSFKHLVAMALVSGSAGRRVVVREYLL
jgi:hypothetical protein